MKETCEAQLDRDIFQCRMVGSCSCYEQAYQRYAACLARKYLYSIIEVIMDLLSRLLTYDSGNGEITVEVRIASPHRTAQGWSCAYQIAWPGAPRRGFGHGVDAMQAMLLAFHAIGTDIYTSDYHRSGRLRWEQAGQGYGFPVPPVIRGLLVGDDARFFG
ncbi:MAG: hypothetical protein QHC89_16180 [Bosea sp. (in: a-proteobacteria)]|nr:hypothetical protein [Bosea sp. (in: a-proteobacteria)]